MYVIVTCKYEMDPTKNSQEKMETPFLQLFVYGDFSDTEGQLTPQSVVGSGRISNSFKLFCMSLLPASMGGRTGERGTGIWGRNAGVEGRGAGVEGERG